MQSTEPSETLFNKSFSYTIQLQGIIAKHKNSNNKTLPSSSAFL